MCADMCPRDGATQLTRGVGRRLQHYDVNRGIVHLWCAAGNVEQKRSMLRRDGAQRTAEI